MKKCIMVLAVGMMAAGLSARGLYCGKGAMTPMEAKLEQMSGNKEAKSTRIQNAQRASKKLKRAVPGATEAASGEKVSYRRVQKSGCCRCKQTIEASSSGCSVKVGVGATKAEAESAARSSKAGSKVTL